MGDSEQKEKMKDSSIEEYRLVPVERSPYFDEDEKIIDLVGVSRDLWDHRSVILKFLIAFLLLGIVTYISAERIYYSETILMPESSGTSTAGQLFQQFQPLLGIQQDTGDPDGLSVNLYPRIVESLPFQVELIQKSVYFESLEREATLFEYLTGLRERTFLQKTGSILWNSTLGLPATLSSLFSSGAEGEEQAVEIDFESFRDLEQPQNVDYRIRQASETMSNWITVRIEPQTGFIVIGVAMPDSRASSETVNIVREQLKQYVTRYRTEKAIEDRDFIQQQYEIARERYLESQEALVTYQDANQNPATARAGALEQRLTADFTRFSGIYNTFATRLEEARIRVQEETPVFSIYEPVTVPSNPSLPNWKRVFAGAIFLGLFFGVVWIYSRRGLSRFVQEFHNRDRNS
ncbi:MAG: Wzz/FepE/Etk N-terminal domain-containing protein [Balneolaceae bacterium]